MLTDEPSFMPYGPGQRTVEVVRRIHAGTTPAIISIKALSSLGVAAGNADRVQKSIRFLNLIGPEFELTQNAVALRKATSGEYQEHLARILKEAYEPIFIPYDPATATGIDLDNAFKPYDPAGQRPNMIALFMALCREAGLAPEGAAAPRRGRPPIAGKQKEAKEAKGKIPTTPPAREAPGIIGGQAKRLPPLVRALVDEIPAQDEPWPREDFADWMNLFKASIERAYKIPA